MIYLKLFLTFLEIGTVSFGGGYGMIPLIRDAVMSNGWLSEDEFINFIAISESTPGPLAVNMSTFIGSTQAGIAGAFVATLGVVLPSFIIILIIASLINNLLRFGGVQAFLSGIRPCVVALILATAVTLGLKTLFGFENIHSSFVMDIRAVAILAILACVGAVYKKMRSKQASPYSYDCYCGSAGRDNVCVMRTIISICIFDIFNHAI